MLLVVFTVSMFVSSALLFLVEPMMAKMALPMLGGTPAVWNTCLVFFQTILLAGYLYAYASTKWLRRRSQIILHVSLALTPLAVLPLHIPAGWEPPSDSTPVFWVLAMLSVAVGLPFFLLSSSTPMLQRWFSHSGHKSANDPYFLYAASNAGSLVGLLGYPLLLEPALRLSVQSTFWSFGYALFLVLTVACGALVWRNRTETAPAQAATIEEPDETAPRDMWRQRLRWIALAFVPSSLMMGVTTALTTDVPAIPLFWVLPLAFYLLSFVLVFAKRPPISHEWLIRRLPFLILIALIPTLCKTKLPLLALIALYLLTLFAIALVCHGELARSRPKITRLTEFYLWISFGGVLGGIFNALIAPVIFSTVVEFPLVLVLAAMLRPPIDQTPPPPEKAARVKRNDWLLPIALFLVMAGILTGLAHAGIELGSSLIILIFGYSMLWCMSFGKRPLRFAAGLVALLAASTLYHPNLGKILEAKRNFFGVIRVTDSPNGKLRYLLHGGTLHGSQSLDAARAREPLAYYTQTGPAGSILRAMQAKTLPAPAGDPRQANWAVVGLGAGAMACYLQPGESLTYYEIDPLVEQMALDPHYFTFLQQCAPQAKIVLGDARLKLRPAPDAGYDLIVIDAFSGDMIPMHLVTREALALYLRKLAPGGMLAFHITNLYLDIAPTLGSLANDAGLVCMASDDRGVSQDQLDAGKLASHWLVMARSRADLGPLATDPHWVDIHVPPGTKVWTDDYSNLLHVIKWK
ncbi:MAG: fused MFS/spermidine synthase [Terracidiphilus sp.]